MTDVQVVARLIIVQNREHNRFKVLPLQDATYSWMIFLQDTSAMALHL